MIDSRHFFILGLLMVMFTVASCRDRGYEQKLLERQRIEDSLANSIEGKTSNIPKDHFETIVFEGCEYLVYKEEPDSNSAFGFMAHKGNCNNPIHVSNPD
ncbi:MULTISPECIES: hypothetical protein [unclassified Flagellimonas]|uniref:Uncharacterized protein n=1 Tax=Flagellimonas sp. MMG031 TaxID=3158549 RepID=A0AAU7N0N8_9FLAO